MKRLGLTLLVLALTAPHASADVIADLASKVPDTLIRETSFHQAMCRKPCGVDLDSKRSYYIDGKSFPSSKPFKVPAGGRVQIDVRPGSYVKRYFGVLGVALGGTFVVAAIATAASGDDTGPIVFGVSGVPILIGGIVLCATSRTTFTIRPAAPEHTAIRLDVARGALTF